MTAALRAGDRKTADALRLLISSLKNAQIDAGGKLDDVTATKCIKREIKKRIEARDMFSNNGRQEQASKEEFERSLYQNYVPEEMSAENIDAIIADTALNLEDLKFASLMSAVMKAAMGRADGRLVSERVKNFLDNKEANTK